MKKILFACDLDNTLIHSYKKKSADDICVEIYNGNEQSFISARTKNLLKEIAEKIIFVPITTRSVEQYKRIFWFENFSPSFVVTTNGAKFFCNGAEEKNWKNYFQNFILPYKKEMENLLADLSEKKFFTRCRIVDKSFLFLSCEEEFDAKKISAELQTKTKLCVESSGRKIYLFPPSINKGESLKLLKEKFAPEKIFCAGDSEIDLAMINLADFAFVPKNFPAEKISHKNFIKLSDSPKFAEEFLKILAEKIHEKSPDTF